MDFRDLSLNQVKDPLEKRMLFLAWLAEKVHENGRKSSPVLVGGGAVEFYTSGNYATKDIDIVFGDIELLNRILLPEGFKKEGRYWFSDEYDIIVECPGSNPPEKIMTVNVNGVDVQITAIEEIIVDRLCAAKFWRSRSDMDWVRVMLKAGIKINVDYLRRRAETEDVADFLDGAMK